MIGRAAQPSHIRQNAHGIDFSIIAESIDDGSSCGFIVAMQRELQAAFGVLQSSRMVVAYAAHVIGRCDSPAFARSFRDITTAVGQFDRLHVIRKPYLVSPENKQRVQLTFDIIKSFSETTRFRPRRV